MAAPLEAHRIAPPWRRGLASLLDSLPFVLVALPFIRRSRGERAPPPRRGLLLAVTALGGAYQVSLITILGQTLGQRAAGIRVVDQNTAAQPTLRQSAVRWALTFVPDALSRLVPVSDRVERTLAAMDDLHPEVERLAHRNRGDRRGLNQALMALYEERDVNPVDALPMLVRVLPGLVYTCALYGPVLQGPLHQGLHDRVAGTVVIQEPGT